MGQVMLEYFQCQGAHSVTFETIFKLCLIFSVASFCSVNCRWLILWCKIANAYCLCCKSSSPSKCLEFD